MFTISFVTDAVVPEDVVVLRTAADGWADRAGEYTDGAWQFMLDERDYTEGLEFKFVILPGRWIISLPETLWRSGAESTLASLWPVDDAVALSFMVRFYDALSRLPRDAALREVQLACLGGTLECGPRSIDTRPPFHWAGFNLSGDSGRLRL